MMGEGNFRLMAENKHGIDIIGHAHVQNLILALFIVLMKHLPCLTFNGINAIVDCFGDWSLFEVTKGTLLWKYVSILIFLGDLCLHMLCQYNYYSATVTQRILSYTMGNTGNGRTYGEAIWLKV